MAGSPMKTRTSAGRPWRKIAGFAIAFVACLLIGSGVMILLEREAVTVEKVFFVDEWTTFEAWVRNVWPTRNETESLAASKEWIPVKHKCAKVTAATQFLNDWKQWGSNVDGFIRKIKLLCGEENLTYVKQIEETQAWEYLDSLYFAMTVLTTIGYGHRSPKTDAGKIFCIFYAIFGIPVTGMLLAKLGDTFSSNMLDFYEKWFRFCGEKTKASNVGVDNMAHDGSCGGPSSSQTSPVALHVVEDDDISIGPEKQRFELIAATLTYIILGFTVLVFLPALAFTLIENWSYLDALYFAVMTLSSIGFGDLVAGLHAAEPTWNIMYKILVTFWVVIGLAYWATVLTFIMKAMRAIRLKQVHAHARMALKHLGIMQHDPVFLSESSKCTLELMVHMAEALSKVGGVVPKTSATAIDGATTATSATRQQEAARDPPLTPVVVVSREGSVEVRNVA